MKPTPTPPDMSKVQAAELKQLRRNLHKIDSDITKESRRLIAHIDGIDRDIVTERAAITRRAQKEIKTYAAKALKAQRPLKAQLARIMESRGPSFKARAAIANRINVLEGRLGS